MVRRLPVRLASVRGETEPRQGACHLSLFLQAEFNWARAGTLVIDFYWMYYFHRYLRNEGGKPPVQSDATLLIISVGMSFILMHYMQVRGAAARCAL